MRVGLSHEAPIFMKVFVVVGASGPDAAFVTESEAHEHASSLKKQEGLAPTVVSVPLFGQSLFGQNKEWLNSERSTAGYRSTRGR